MKILKKSLGAILFQFPPWFKKNNERLSNFLKILPQDIPAVFEFRDDSWYDDEIAGILKERNFIFCFSDMDEKKPPEIISTSDWEYVRLRREEYSDRDLENWAKEIKTKNWEKVLVFFKHEGDGTGPMLAKKFSELFH